MADIVQQYYEKYFSLMLGAGGQISVAQDFHGQMAQVNTLLKNDQTALISTILDFMIQSATVDFGFDAQNDSLNRLLLDWKKNVNKNVNIDIPKGLRNFEEQLIRERLKSSMIAVKIRWGKMGGFKMPVKMWVMDGASIWVENKGKALNTNKYYLGQPNSKKTNILKDTEHETVLIRKPYNQWYDKYPTPYLVKSGALYHAMFKQKMLSRIAEVITTAFPYQFFIKMGTEQAINQGKAPTDEQMKKQLEMFQDSKSNTDEHQFAKGIGGAFPQDVNFEELIPSYEKVLDEKLMAPIDKNILSALGMIELKGFSSNREEMILNPKVMVEEVTDIVSDMTDFFGDIMDLIKDKNGAKYTTNESIEVSSGVIESFMTDNMRNFVRSWYDRGLISMENGVEDTTSLNFKTQVKKREKENKDGLDILMYPRKTQNMDQEETEEVTPDKNTKTPEADNYKNASVETDLITEPMKTIRSIPEDIKKSLTKAEQQIFKISFNQGLEIGKSLGYDNFLLEKTAMEFATKKAFKK